MILILMLWVLSECSLNALWMLSECSEWSLTDLWPRKIKIDCSRLLLSILCRTDRKTDRQTLWLPELMSVPKIILWIWDMGLGGLELKLRLVSTSYSLYQCNSVCKNWSKEEKELLVLRAANDERRKKWMFSVTDQNIGRRLAQCSVVRPWSS